MRLEKKKPPCPKCGRNNVIPIVYGEPDIELFEQSKMGKVKLGGCVVGLDDPEWHCPTCNLDFDTPSKITVDKL
ncbi:hypothetical protein H1S01_17375 [Heliobacterium chlorum]|uniref:Rubredoxin n=2 Tax=Heliobacterium chlorum TaxID=2698 RepID=A0ABR7T8A5_HELCL|nr:hypothetical protein [Heliobacterium chlorum]